jgi:hypothetical protein
MLQIQHVNIEENKKFLISKSWEHNNYSYLCQENEDDFPLLSQICPCYPLEYGKIDMAQLINELGKVKITVETNDELVHIEQIILMCLECCKNKNSVIIFNPFWQTLGISYE